MAKIKDKESLKRLTDLTPVAREILKHIVDKELPIKLSFDKKDEEAYDEVSKEVLAILLKHNVKFVDKDFLFQLTSMPLDRIKETIMMSLKFSLDKVIDKALGKGFRELNMEDMDKLLKKLPSA